ncbi:unnamed protein product, partial [Coregonus sp. 'balchen']
MARQLCFTMAQWMQMKQLIPYLAPQILNQLYTPSFPLDVRCYLANWIEEQRWEDFEPEKVDQESQAVSLLDQIISCLQSLAGQNPNVVERMRLQHISKNMEQYAYYRAGVGKLRPIQCRTHPCCRTNPGLSIFRSQPLQLVLTVRDVLRKERELLSRASTQIPAIAHFSQDPMAVAPTTRDVDLLVLKVLDIQNCRQQIHQLQEELNWERQNYESMQGPLQPTQTNGMDPSMSEVTKLQTNINQHEYNGQVIAKKRIQLLQEAVTSLEKCQSHLISRIKAWSSLMVDKQPPQVIKTQSKFSTTVRYLLGDKVAPGKPVLIKAQIITEAQARNLRQLGTVPSENVGELINNTAILEHTSSKSTCATFRNMSIKKIKRADRKGSESVTEEKFALFFTTEISITGCDTPYRIQMISVPVVVIVHGSQDNNALATIIWDCAFAEPMCVTLNSKFMSDVGTERCFDSYNQHFLAQKIFDKPDIAGDYSNMLVSWAQFNKEMLPGRPFTFWQWFDGVIELTKRHLKSYWSDGLIFGFIGKQHLHLILKDRPNGTFLLRFSDSEIGGITIAYVAPSENLPKNDVFRRYYT